MKASIKILSGFILLICILAILGAGLLIADYCLEYYQGTKSYEEITHLAETPSDANAEAHDTNSSEEKLPSIDFDVLRAVNPDLIGWIYIPDTRINYPIVKRENDNNYYLSHLFDGSENKTGCIFLDTRCSLGDPHILIHGHNMANGSMFRDLNLFRSREFLDSHPTFWILTPERNYEVTIFACSVVDLGSGVWQLEFPDDSQKQSWLSICQREASLRTGVIPSPSDQIVTLSTCSYEFDQARWIVQARILSTKD